MISRTTSIADDGLKKAGQAVSDPNNIVKAVNIANTVSHSVTEVTEAHWGEI